MGYPSGLSGEDIPLIAQIIPVADVYDALTSNRAYRDAMEMLIGEKEKTLNPKMVDVFYDELRKKTNKEVALSSEPLQKLLWQKQIL